MPGHLVKVKKKMGIYAKRRVKTVLSGNYGSVFKGRGMDFDDLRPYMYGDDVKDIDWKASARSRAPMIRRYIAIRKHNIMILADSGLGMAALAPSGEKKSDLATFAAGVIAYIASKNGDLVGMTFGNNAGNSRFALKEGANHIENFLDKYSKSVSLESSESNINNLLTYVSKNFRERMFLIVITDVHGATSVSEDLLRRLRVRHEQMFILVQDSTLTNQKFKDAEVRDVTANLRLPRFIRHNKKLSQAEATLRQNSETKVQHDLRRLGICSCILNDTETAIPNIFKMLEEQKHVRR